MNLKNNEDKLKQVMDGVNSLLNDKQKFSMAGLKVKEGEIINSENELLQRIEMITSGAADLESWCLFSDRIAINFTDFNRENLLKLQEAEFYSNSGKKTCRIRRIDTSRFVMAEYILSGSEGNSLLYREQMVCLRQDLVKIYKFKNINYLLWYRECDGEKGKIVPYLQQFIGFKEV